MDVTTGTPEIESCWMALRDFFNTPGRPTWEKLVACKHVLGESVGRRPPNALAVRVVENIRETHPTVSDAQFDTLVGKAAGFHFRRLIVCQGSPSSTSETITFHAARTPTINMADGLGEENGEIQRGFLGFLGQVKLGTVLLCAVVGAFFGGRTLVSRKKSSVQQYIIMPSPEGPFNIFSGNTVKLGSRLFGGDVNINSLNNGANSIS